jgi:ankyrin repeat protein
LLATERGHEDYVKTLIARGALVNKGDDGGNTPLHLAAQRGNIIN